MLKYLCKCVCVFYTSVLLDKEICFGVQYQCLLHVLLIFFNPYFYVKIFRICKCFKFTCNSSTCLCPSFFNLLYFQILNNLFENPFPFSSFLMWGPEGTCCEEKGSCIALVSFLTRIPLLLYVESLITIAPSLAVLTLLYSNLSGEQFSFHYPKHPSIISSQRIL